MMPKTRNLVSKFLKSNRFNLHFHALFGLRQARDVLNAEKMWRTSNDDNDLLELSVTIARYCVWLLRE